MMRHKLVVVVVLAVAAGLLVVAAPPPRPQPAAAQASEGLRILAAGDSYAAGEGLPGIQSDEGQCQRALGLEAEAGTTPSKAWPVLVKEAFEGHDDEAQRWAVDTFWFTACTGNVARNFSTEPNQKRITQLTEATADAGADPWHVVTLSLGGNDAGFAEVLRDCIGMDGDLGEAGSLVPGVFWDKVLTGAYAGCEQSEAEITQRVDPSLRAELPVLYDEVAAVTAPGGLVVVTGYPQVFEDPVHWSSWEKARNRCERISEGDARTLRGATGRANEVIGQEVLAAQGRHDQLTWVFVDVSRAFEPDEGPRHGLCAAEEWLNGFSLGGVSSGDFRGWDDDQVWNFANEAFNRSYHPNQAGHGGYSAAVVGAITSSGWTPASLGGDVWEVDLQNTTFPADSCRRGEWASSPPITVVDGEGTAGEEYADDDLGTGYAEVYGVELAGYADIDGDGRDDVVVRLLCSAGGTHGEWIVVPLRLDGRVLELLGGTSIGPVVTEPGLLDLPDRYGGYRSSEIGDASLDGTDIVVTEAYDATGDQCNACHTGRASVRWSWDGSGFQPSLEGGRDPAPAGVPSGPDGISADPATFLRQLAATWAAGRTEALAWFGDPGAFSELPDPTPGAELVVPDPFPLDCLQGSSGAGGCELLLDDGDGVCCATIWKVDYYSTGPDGTLRVSDITFAGDAG